MSAIDEGGPDGSVSGPSFHPTGHSADVQQLDRPMPEEVRPQYKDAVTDNAKSDMQLLSGLRRSAKSSQSDIAVKEVVLLLAVIRPYAGKAIGLQLDTDLKRVHHCSSWLRQVSSTGRTPFT